MQTLQQNLIISMKLTRPPLILATILLSPLYVVIRINSNRISEIRKEIQRRTKVYSKISVFDLKKGLDAREEQCRILWLSQSPYTTSITPNEFRRSSRRLLLASELKPTVWRHSMMDKSK